MEAWAVSSLLIMELELIRGELRGRCSAACYLGERLGEKESERPRSSRIRLPGGMDYESQE